MNAAAVEVLYAVAKELAQQAEDSMPKLRGGEEITLEWYRKGEYYRETSFNGEISAHLYDFRQRKSHQVVAGKIIDSYSISQSNLDLPRKRQIDH